METYRVFSRSATNWEEFAHARKTTIKRHLSYQEARDLCCEFNDNRNARQKKRGMKYEFEQE